MTVATLDVIRHQSCYAHVLLLCSATSRPGLCDHILCYMQGSGKDLIQPVLDNQLKAASPLLVPAKVDARPLKSCTFLSAWWCLLQMLGTD